MPYPGTAESLRMRMATAQSPSAIGSPWPRITLVHGQSTSSEASVWDALSNKHDECDRVVSHYVRNVSDQTFVLSLHPVIFAVSAVIVFAFTKEIPYRHILVLGWILSGLYFVGGFIGPEQLTVTDTESVLRITVKLWISIVGFPWLALA